MDFIKRIRSYDYTGISFITNDNIKKCIQFFGNCSIIRKRELKPKRNETLILNHDGLLNTIFPPDLSLTRISPGI